jgi:hypothetical protein
MLTMSPGTRSCIGTDAKAPSRRTLAWTTIIFWSAATLADALPSWFRPIAAFNSVRPIRRIPVATWLGMNRLRMPAASSTICIGSLYWRMNACQRGSLGASANLFLPYFAWRLSTSAADKPASSVTPSWPSVSSPVRACHAGAASPPPPVGAAPVATAAVSAMDGTSNQTA